MSQQNTTIRQRAKDQKDAFLVVMSSFLVMGGGSTLVVRATSDDFADKILETIKQGVNSLISGILGVIINGVTGIGEKAFDKVEELTGLVFDMLLAIPRQITGMINAIFGGVAKFFAGLFSFQLTGNSLWQSGAEVGMQATSVGGVAQPPIVWAIVGTTTATVGAAIIIYSERIPVVGDFLSTAGGGTLILVGSVVGMYGLYPQYGGLVIGGAFGIVLLGGFYVLYQQLQEQLGP